MITTLHTRAFALAGAIAGALLTALCFASYALLGRPDPWMDLLVGSGPSVGGWIVGIVEVAVFSGLTGAVVAAVYNRLARPASGA